MKFNIHLQIYLILLIRAQVKNCIIYFYFSLFLNRIFFVVNTKLFNARSELATMSVSTQFFLFFIFIATASSELRNMEKKTVSSTDIETSSPPSLDARQSNYIQSQYAYALAARTAVKPITYYLQRDQSNGH